MAATGRTEQCKHYRKPAKQYQKRQPQDKAETGGTAMTKTTKKAMMKPEWQCGMENDEEDTETPMTMTMMATMATTIMTTMTPMDFH